LNDFASLRLASGLHYVATMGSTMVAMMVIAGVAHHTPSYFEQKAAQVFASFHTFKTARTAAEEQDPLQQARDRDALLLPGGAVSMRSGALGSMVMGAAVVLAAHAPAQLRPIVDGPVHVGPALFEGGGMGAGIGARF
jgi:hypothetical protein